MSVVARARARWERRLVDAGRVLRPVDEDSPVFDFDTLQYALTSPVVVWSGPCLLLPPGSSAAGARSSAGMNAGRPVARSTWAVLVPVDAVVRVGDVFELTAEAEFAGLVGRQWAIEVDAGSPRDALRELTLTAEEAASESQEGV